MEHKYENEWGIVLCGGGAKGAYQIGVWKALKEYGIFEQISGISGVSIGAINEILMAGADYETAERVWKEINFLTVFDTEPELIDMVEGTFSRNEMIDIMRENIDYDKVANSSYSLYVNITRTGTNMEDQGRIPVYDSLNHKTASQMEKIILASSALPIVYEAVLIDGYYYRDGGLTDNMPIKPLYEQGYRKIIVVGLSHTAAINTDLYPDCEIVLIRPSKSLGNTFSGTLSFNKRDIEMRMELGYRDARRVLHTYFEKKEISEAGLQALAEVDYEDIERTARQNAVLNEVNSHMDQLNAIMGKYDIEK